MMRLEVERPLAWPVSGGRDLPSGGPSILIVSDSAPVSERLRDSYRRNGHRLHVTDDAIAALETLNADPAIGVAVVRHAPPRFDGLALIQRMRACLRGRNCQFILIAEDPSPDDVVRAFHMQVADVINDPADGARLHHALVRALSTLQAHPAPLAIGMDRQQVLDEAYRHGLALIEAVRSLRRTGNPLSEHEGQRTAAAQPLRAEAPKPRSSRMDRMRALQRARTARDRLFPKGLFEDPCWDMLVDLTINDALGKRISVSSLCVASGVAQTTALRRIAELNERGLIRRVADERDGRRVFVELTEPGREAMARYVDHIERLV